jgi:hypothetical protein
MSNLHKTLTEIRQRSAVAPHKYKIINRDQLDALRESPEDVRTLLGILDGVLLVLRDADLAQIHKMDLLLAMEATVTPDLTLVTS